jgi:hypothetical protein
MAYEQMLRPVGLPTSADLTTGGTVNPQFLFVVMTATGIALAGAGVSCIGVLQDKPNAAGQEAEVAVVGMISKVVAGAAVNEGDQIMSNASGQGITATAGNFVNGFALAAASGAGVLIPVLITGPYKI